MATNHNNTMDPGQPANQIAMFRRAANGSLQLEGYFDTGGQGSGPSRRAAGNGLGSACSVDLTHDHRFLLVTNAGSNNLSVFRVKNKKLKLVELVPTGDGRPSRRFPTSVAHHGDLVYVLNSADQGSITGFRFDDQKGTLTPIADSIRFLNANQTYPPDTMSNPAHVSFTPDGRKLIVTIKDGPAEGESPGFRPTGPSRVLVFDVMANGAPSERFTQTNLDNAGPVGFSFDRDGHLLLTLFIGGDNHRSPSGDVHRAGAVGSFRINADNSLTEISRVKIDQFDTCWIESHGELAYASNYTSGTLSSFLVGPVGTLRKFADVAGTTDDMPNGNNPGQNRQGSTPLDLRISPDGRFVYAVLPGSGRVGGWRINSDGSLTKIGEFPGLPKTINGDHAPEERFGPGGSPAGMAVH